jgi:hypothetical protein
MTFPIILFGLVVAVLIGALFHVLRGGSGWHLLLYIGLSVLGFALGQWLNMVSGWELYMFGMLDLGMGAVGSVLSLSFGEWLSRVEKKNKSGV